MTPLEIGDVVWVKDRDVNTLFGILINKKTDLYQFFIYDKYGKTVTGTYIKEKEILQDIENGRLEL